MRAPARPLTTLVACTGLAVGAVIGSGPIAQADDARPAGQAQQTPPPMRSGHGITVQGVERLSERSFRVVVTDPAVSAPDQVIAPDKKLSVIVTLPAGYETSGKRYPTLYLLHGRGGNVHDMRGAAEGPVTQGKDLITVMPEGGHASWYTDWAQQPSGTAQWETFHVKHVIPWIDQNLRTKAAKQHRAIGGFSMGGYGAVHYAFKHPDTFNHVSSYSGGLDMEDQLVRGAVLITPFLQGREGHPVAPGNGHGPFGNPVWPNDGRWKAENPVRHAEKLRGVGISLYAGDGLGANDGAQSRLIERGAGNSTNNLAKRLTALGIPHHWEMYGHDVSYGGFTCNGGHTTDCLNMAFSKDINRIMADIG